MQHEGAPTWSRCQPALFLSLQQCQRRMQRGGLLTWSRCHPGMNSRIFERDMNLLLHCVFLTLGLPLWQVTPKVDATWTCAQIAKVVCDELVAQGLLKETPSFIRSVLRTITCPKCLFALDLVSKLLEHAALDTAESKWGRRSYGRASLFPSVVAYRRFQKTWQNVVVLAWVERRHVWSGVEFALPYAPLVNSGTPVRLN